MLTRIAASVLLAAGCWACVGGSGYPGRVPGTYDGSGPYPYPRSGGYPGGGSYGGDARGVARDQAREERRLYRDQQERRERLRAQQQERRQGLESEGTWNKKNTRWQSHLYTLSAPRMLPVLLIKS